MNTTESIVSTSAFPGNLSCVLSNNVCVLEGTEDLCDPCEGVDFCAADKSCLADNSTCTISCVCTDEKMTQDQNGVCINPCEPNPCQHNRPCVSDLKSPSKFHCDCGSNYAGDFCETDPCDPNPCANKGSCIPDLTLPVSKFRCDCGSDYDPPRCEEEHNYCYDEHPAGCPLGAIQCAMNGVGNYNCSCAPGHILDEAANNCTKVSQRLDVTLIFSTLYMEAYNVEGTDERNMAITAINAAMGELYGDRLLLPITYYNFTQGSLVANYSMNMRMATNGDPQQNVYDLMTYTTNCETNNPAGKDCFGALGKPHVPLNGIDAEDLRCVGAFCPVGTECFPIDKSENSVRCSCSYGYKLVNTVTEDGAGGAGKLVDQCDVIDLCKENNTCLPEQICDNNIPGFINCVASPCDKKPCPGNAVCSAIDQHAYECQCDWIYIASDCGTPWPLILVIVSSVLLALLILAVIGLIILFSRSKKGSSVIDTTSF